MRQTTAAVLIESALVATATTAAAAATATTTAAPTATATGAAAAAAVALWAGEAFAHVGVGGAVEQRETEDAEGQRHQDAGGIRRGRHCGSAKIIMFDSEHFHREITALAPAWTAEEDREGGHQTDDAEEDENRDGLVSQIGRAHV